MAVVLVLNLFVLGDGHHILTAACSTVTQLQGGEVLIMMVVMMQC